MRPARGLTEAAIGGARLRRVKMAAAALRHTAASLAVSAGANVKAVQRMMGHQSAAMTLDIYTDLFDDDLDALADRLEQSVSKVRPIASLPAVASA
ncbi:MAG: site-specific integrase [Nocardia sp.]|uniref:tyrosine-type recombinase/integrase n=1 Tax=Nocardia sp. TaxID=1821 RepID=UPI003F90807A|nr:site-specific integrase [Nocardia sp.]